MCENNFFPKLKMSELNKAVTYLKERFNYDEKVELYGRGGAMDVTKQLALIDDNFLRDIDLQSETDKLPCIS